MAIKFKIAIRCTFRNTDSFQISFIIPIIINSKGHPGFNNTQCYETYSMLSSDGSNNFSVWHIFRIKAEKQMILSELTLTSFLLREYSQLQIDIIDKNFNCQERIIVKCCLSYAWYDFDEDKLLKLLLGHHVELWWSVFSSNLQG